MSEFDEKDIELVLRDHCKDVTYDWKGLAVSCLWWLKGRLAAREAELESHKRAWDKAEAIKAGYWEAIQERDRELAAAREEVARLKLEVSSTEALYSEAEQDRTKLREEEMLAPVQSEKEKETA